ncbi:unnamed protein product [Phaedon cochleariae]|uniref:Bromo domain-containing protein n=1 Tax=Phaedon cochleariae TaxID=80249 RepID=A0A9P0DUJ7_PHACE|nr:unnamed protein product [Phaedon cochleariae]
MVNTRRKDSNGSPPGPIHRTRGSLRLIKPEQEEGSRSSTVEDSDSEDSTAKDSSFNLPLKPKEPIESSTSLPSRQLRSRRFGFSGRNFNAHSVGSNHNRRSLDERRSLAVYSHKMHDDSEDSEDEIYTVRGRRSKHLIRMSRMQRRSALSLRPISQKSYADPNSPLHFNSDSEGGVRRSKRKRSNLSWLADSQMHKVGYPNLNAGYSEEDSRDAVDAVHAELEMTRRVTRRGRNVQSSKYLYDYETEGVPQREFNRRRRKTRRRRESNDKENKEHLLNGRLRSSAKTDNYEENKEGETENNEEVDESNKDAGQEEKEEPKVNGERAESEKENEEIKQPQSSGTEDDQDNIPLTRLRTTRTRSNNRTNPMYSTRAVGHVGGPVRPEKVMESSSSEEEAERKYSLRDRRPKPPPKVMQKTILRNREMEMRTRRHFTRRRRQVSDSSSDSTSSDVRCSKPPKSPHSKNEKMKSGAGGSTKIVPIKPETLDASVRFSSVGGLDGHIQCLKEMVLLPMLYPEVFAQFRIQPPRGVLFHGPPGTGKTMIARALANECSFGHRKVSFFLRKGADLLSKWIGESEKQLKMLFEKAAEMKPSIIFFDELDGLAPVRTFRSDQVHASIVSTLLALMDGLSDRGEVIIIGATNRIDAIDPALRRPGRFDRELLFPLPSRSEREEILNVHTTLWSKPPSKQMLGYLAENTVGYCGSDLRALCSEAVIQSFRKTYPQVYNSEHRLLLNPENVKVEKVDFMRAKSLLVPASQRVAQGLGRKLFPVLEPLLQDSLKKSLSILEHTFPHGLSASLAKVKLSPNVRPAQLIITGNGSGHGQTSHLGPAILFKMEHIHAYLLDLCMLYQETGRSAEEACIQVFGEARKNVPSIVYIPSIDKWWCLVSETVHAIFKAQLAQLDPNIPILFLATSETVYSNLPDDVQSIFSHYRKEVQELRPAPPDRRRAFYRPLIVEGGAAPMRCFRERPKAPPPLPRAPTPVPAPLTEAQAKLLYETEEHTLRELRIFLRDVCKKLANNKLFYMFTKPVDTEEVPDYTTIITQPMDLETMMTKVDIHRYECAKDFLNDIELICQNALEYNPARSSADKQIRHRACSLRDYAYTLIKTEMDTDFEDKCQDISKKRKARKHCATKYLPPYINTPEAPFNHDQSMEIPENLQNGDHKETIKSTVKSESRTPMKKRKRISWKRGELTKRKKKRTSDISLQQTEGKLSSDDESKEIETELKADPAANSVIPGIDPADPAESAAMATPQVDSGHLVVDNEITTPLTIDCDSSGARKSNASSPLQSPKRRLSDLLSPSELLDNPLDFDDVEEALNENVSENIKNRKPIECPLAELEKVLDKAVDITDGCSLVTLLDLYNQLSRIIKSYSRTTSRNSLPKELSKELARFKKQETSNKSLSSTAAI